MKTTNKKYYSKNFFDFFKNTEQDQNSQIDFILKLQPEPTNIQKFCRDQFCIDSIVCCHEIDNTFRMFTVEETKLFIIKNNLIKF
jgi:hypothetical protein